MRYLNLALEDFIDALETAHDEAGFRGAADRLAARLGYRWFAYLGFSESALKVISSYPASWARRYFDQGYERIDPVVREARSAQQAFRWGHQAKPPLTTQQQRFMSEAAEFGIHRGVTVPIRGGFGRFAAFTLAGDSQAPASDRQTETVESLQLAGLYYHAHVYAKLQLGLNRLAAAPLTQRERQCLSWAAYGKKMPEIALILGISTRTVVFHLENVRSKLSATTLTQAVAVATQRGLIVS